MLEIARRRSGMSTTEKPGGSLSDADLLAIHREIRSLIDLPYFKPKYSLVFESGRIIAILQPSDSFKTRFERVRIVIDSVHFWATIGAAHTALSTLVRFARDNVARPVAFITSCFCTIREALLGWFSRNSKPEPVELDGPILDSIDDICTRQGGTRSDVIERAVTAYRNWVERGEFGDPDKPENKVLVTTELNSCSDCSHHDHSGAFTPGGARPVCNHRTVCESRGYEWQCRIVPHHMIKGINGRPTYELDEIPDWCPFRKRKD